MKVKWTEETTTRVISNLIIVSGGVLLYFFILNFGWFWHKLGWFFGLLAPFITGFIIAYLLNGPVCFYERQLTRFFFRQKARPKFARMLAVTLSYATAILILVMIIYSIVPQLASSIKTLADNMPSYVTSFNALTDSIMDKLQLEGNFFERFIGSWQEIFTRLGTLLETYLPQIVDFSKQFTSGVMNFFFGFILSIYLLASKERFIAQIKKALFALLPTKSVTAAIRLARYTNKTFGRYVTGQLLDSLVLGVLCFLCMSIFRMEYALLISFFVGVTNIIPFIGPVIGAVPGVFILLMVDPWKALWFVVLVIVLQQLDGNLLAPRIVGKSTGLPAFWVIFAIVLGGGFFGIWGIILGVPGFSVLYMLIKNILENRLKNKNLPAETQCYNDTEFPL